MDQNTNILTIELNLKLQLKDYKLILGLKRAWILALIGLGIQLATYFYQHLI